MFISAFILTFYIGNTFASTVGLLVLSPPVVMGGGMGGGMKKIFLNTSHSQLGHRDNTGHSYEGQISSPTSSGQI